jgi:hypothetical protein
MTEKKERLPYQPPQITRVVLRQEQAILSQCSTAADKPRDLGSPSVQTCARKTDNCRAWASSGANSDSGYRPS